MYSLLGKVTQIYMGGMKVREMSFTNKTIVLMQNGFKLIFRVFLIYKIGTEIISNHHKTSLFQRKQDTGLSAHALFSQLVCFSPSANCSNRNRFHSVLTFNFVPSVCPAPHLTLESSLFSRCCSNFYSLDGASVSPETAFGFA